MRLIDADALIKKAYDEAKGMAEPYDDFGVLVEWLVDKATTIEPERKKGEWIEDGYNHYKAVCSECGEPCGTYVMGKPRDRFCKWCGADMREEGEQE